MIVVLIKTHTKNVIYFETVKEKDSKRLPLIIEMAALMKNLMVIDLSRDDFFYLYLFNFYLCVCVCLLTCLFVTFKHLILL